MFFTKGSGQVVFGMGLNLQKCDVERVYDEVERRMQLLYAEGGWTSKELREERVAMTQGVYSALMMLSENWPDVRAACDEVEDETGWWRVD